MNWSFRICLGIILNLCLFAPVLVHAEEEGHAKSDAATSEPVEIKATTITRGRLSEKLLCNGEIQSLPNAQQIIGARAAGVVAEVFHRDGDRVTQGEVIARLDARPFEAARAKAAAMVSEARAELHKASRATSGSETADLSLAKTEAENTLRQAKENADRMRTLLDSHLVAQRQADEAIRAEKLAQEQLAAVSQKGALQLGGAQPEEMARLGARLEQAEADLKIADLNLSYTQLCADQDGVLAEFKASRGQQVDVNAAIGRIINPAEVEALLRVPIEGAAKVHIGSEVEISPLIATTEPLKAKVEAVGATVMADGAMVIVCAALDAPTTGTDDPAPALLPGQFVKAAINIGETAEGFLVPVASILSDEKGHYVLTIVDGKAHKESVTILATEDEMDAVEGRLTDGGQVITDGAYNLPDGATVKTE